MGGVAAQFVFRLSPVTPAAAPDSAFSRAAWPAMIAARLSSDLPKFLSDLRRDEADEAYGARWRT
jgi:hypothetical protein